MVTRVTIQEFPWKILIRVKALTFLFMPMHFKKEGYRWQLCKFNWCHSRCAFMFLGRRVFFGMNKIFISKQEGHLQHQRKKPTQQRDSEKSPSCPTKEFCKAHSPNTWGDWLATWGGTQLKQQKSNSIDKLTVSKITAEDCQLATPPLEL